MQNQFIEGIKISNCKIINTYCESADNSILRIMGKETTAEQIDAALEVVYRMKYASY